MQKLPMLCFNPPYPDNGTGAWTFPLYQAKGYRNAQLTDQGAEFYRIAWNKDFKSWHSENFDETIPPLVILEHAALAAYFMTEKSWTFCPYTTAIRLQKMELAFTNLRILLQSRWYIIW